MELFIYRKIILGRRRNIKLKQVEFGPYRVIIIISIIMMHLM